MTSDAPETKIRAAAVLIAGSLAAVPGYLRADDWSSIGASFVTVYLLLGIFAVQQILSLILAISRGRARGLKSALLFYLGSVLVVPTAFVTVGLLAVPMDEFAPDWVKTEAGLVGIPVLLAVTFCVLHLLLVRRHDRRPENRIWKSTS